tara:strand:+ start:12418 stop:14883 length:2466 start_codon:yes stop_codon:yes gene_type:complete
MKIKKTLRWICGIALLSLLTINTHAEHHVVNLIVDYKTVNFNGTPAKAIAVNNQIPAPTLHFKEGDHVTINVYNHLKVGTSIHWHGLLVPWQMDGVAGISQTAIPPGGVFHYSFTLYQSGTYWYHAHEEFQEQQGLYGSIIIDPKKSSPYHYNKDFVVVLSDWNNVLPEKVYANLKKEGDYYNPRFPLQPSLKKFLYDSKNASPKERKQLVDDYKMMQQMRMSIYDYSDVAYDAYLLNGKTTKDPWTATVKVGDVVRLRFIDAGGSTIFNVRIPDTLMKIIQVDGNNVKPLIVNNISVAPGETYDVLVSIKKPIPYIIYAESIDTLGHTVGALTTSPQQPINYQKVKPFPEPLPITREMMDNMMGVNMSHNLGSSKNMSKMDDMTHSQKSIQSNAANTMPATNNSMNMPTESTIQGDSIVAPETLPEIKTSSNTKYQSLVAAVKTNDPNKPINGVIRMELFGYMDHYVWFINGIPGYQAKPIVLQPGQRYRIIFSNTSMMHHPMHIHGHWFILRNGHGVYDPLLHTIDVPPGATIVTDIDTDANGQWFFHCHQLYHMMAGMNRIFQYSTLIDLEKGKGRLEKIINPLPYTNQAIIRVDKAPINFNLVRDPLGHPAYLFMASFLDADEDPFNNSQEITYKGLFGDDYNKLELYMNEAEINKGTIDNANLDIFYWRLISQFWAVKGGVNYVYRPAKTPYVQPGIGIEGLMPYFIDTDFRLYYHDGGAKADLEFSRNTLIAHNFFIRTAFRGIFSTKRTPQDEVGKGLNTFEFTLRPYYQINPTAAVYLQYKYTGSYGEVKSLLQQDNKSTSENRYSIGLSLLF